LKTDEFMIPESGIITAATGIVRAVDGLGRF
jgi:hypothetical protein